VPTPPHAPAGIRLSRRAVLVAAVLATGSAASACTPGRRRQPEAAPEPEQTVDPDIAVATEALHDQRSMIELLRATEERHGRLGDLVAPALATHEQHAALLADAVPQDGPNASPSSPASPSASATDGAAAGDERGQAGEAGEETDPEPVPRNPARALTRLVEAERQLATATKRHAFKAQSGAFARVLGSMAAAAAQQAAGLETAGAGAAS
jgi:hypothetical protein